LSSYCNLIVIFKNAANLDTGQREDLAVDLH
jgi:hypothetical protein